MTELLFKKLEEELSVLKDAWANGSFASSFSAEFIARNAAAQGACSAYQLVIDYTHEELYGEDDGK